jgi:hypothetical protein
VKNAAELAGGGAMFVVVRAKWNVRPSHPIAASSEAPLGLGRPFLAPPGIPADRLAALRAAMMATSNDPQFRVDCEQQRLECSDLKTSEQIDAMIKRAYATPEQIRKRLIDIYQVGMSAEKK